MTEPSLPHAACDCPCHQGSHVFHVVSCCGSLLTFPLWRAVPRDLSSVDDRLEHTVGLRAEPRDQERLGI